MEEAGKHRAQHPAALGYSAAAQDGAFARAGSDRATSIHGAVLPGYGPGIGGIPSGRITELLGAPTSGKTTLANIIIANAQRRGSIAAYVDLSQTFDPYYASVQLLIEREHWLRRHGDVRGYSARMTVIKSKLAGRGQLALIQFAFNGEVRATKASRRFDAPDFSNCT